MTESTYDGSKPSKKDKKGEVDEEAVAPVPKNYRILKNINVDIKQREMVGIVGGIGSGKSTLAQAILGEVLKESGEVNVGGTIGYVPQTSWIRNDTIRGNIIMDNPSKFVESKYNSIIDKSALKVDIDILEAGDMTEIGAKGINLSGGQKQRVSLARAAYSASDIYIIDDSLSALDAEVSQNVFRNLILGEMGNATRIFITHELHLLNNSQINTSTYIYIYIYISTGDERWRNYRTGNIRGAKWHEWGICKAIEFKKRGEW